MAGYHHRELQMEREALRAYANRANGDSQDPYIVMADHELDFQAVDFLALPRMYFRNDDGSYWKPQDLEGNFQYLPGYDGPVT